jgi:hypothetical protein
VYVEIGAHKGHCINHVARHSDYSELHGVDVDVHDTWPLTTDDTRPGVCGDVYTLREELEAGEEGDVFTHERFPA